MMATAAALVISVTGRTCAVLPATGNGSVTVPTNCRILRVAFDEDRQV